jgi:hypothetical protein
MIMRTFAIPGVAKLAVGKDIADVLHVPGYAWPSVA